MTAQGEAGAGQQTDSQANPANTPKPADNGDWAAGLSNGKGTANRDQGQQSSQTPEQPMDKGQGEPKPDAAQDALMPGVAKPDAAAGKEDEKPAGEEQPKDEYNFDVPPDMSIDKEKIEKFKAIAKEGKLDLKQAQGILDLYHQSLKEQHERYFNDYRNIVAKKDVEWHEEIMRDPELGGKNFDANASHAMKAMRHFMPGKDFDALQELYANANLRNCPPLFRLLSRVGKYLSESRHLADEAEEGSGERAAFSASQWYPDLK